MSGRASRNFSKETIKGTFASYEARDEALHHLADDHNIHHIQWKSGEKTFYITFKGRKPAMDGTSCIHPRNHSTYLHLNEQTKDLVWQTSPVEGKELQRIKRRASLYEGRLTSRLWRPRPERTDVHHIQIHGKRKMPTRNVSQHIPLCKIWASHGTKNRHLQTTKDI
jgi:hypothetical protein